MRESADRCVAAAPLAVLLEFYSPRVSRIIESRRTKIGFVLRNLVVRLDFACVSARLNISAVNGITAEEFRVADNILSRRITRKGETLEDD